MPLSEGMTDAGQCEGMIGCNPNGFGQCVCDGATTPICTATANEPLGGRCLFDSECYNGNCSLGLCRLENAEPCSDNVACGSNRCFENACQECSQDADCLSGACDNLSKTCKVALGEPCGDNADCVAGTCNYDLFCKIVNGSCSADADCGTNLCDSTCIQCVVNGDCASNVCSGVGCKSPAGAYCVEDTVCASGMCQGFPGRCM
jgi:hypothetical protein